MRLKAQDRVCESCIMLVCACSVCCAKYRDVCRLSYHSRNTHAERYKSSVLCCLCLWRWSYRCECQRHVLGLFQPEVFRATSIISWCLKVLSDYWGLPLLSMGLYLQFRCVFVSVSSGPTRYLANTALCSLAHARSSGSWTAKRSIRRLCD